MKGCHQIIGDILYYFDIIEIEYPFFRERTGGSS